MHSKNDDLQINLADMKRRNSSPCIHIGTDNRVSQILFSSLIKELIKLLQVQPMTPNLSLMSIKLHTIHLGLEETSQEKTRWLPQVIDKITLVGTTNLVSPATYFQRGGKSHSTSSLSRVPYDSKLKNEPVFSFTKGPKSLAQYKNSVD